MQLTPEMTTLPVNKKYWKEVFKTAKDEEKKDLRRVFHRTRMETLKSLVSDNPPAWVEEYMAVENYGNVYYITAMWNEGEEFPEIFEEISHLKESLAELHYKTILAQARKSLSEMIDALYQNEEFDINLYNKIKYRLARGDIYLQELEEGIGKLKWLEDKKLPFSYRVKRFFAKLTS